MPEGYGTSFAGFDDDKTRKILAVGASFSNYGVKVLTAHQQKLPFKQDWIRSQVANFKGIRPPAEPGGIRTFNNVEWGPLNPRRIDKWGHSKAIYKYPDAYFISDDENLLGEMQEIDFARHLGNHAKVVQRRMRKRNWYDTVVKEVLGSDYEGELPSMHVTDDELSEEGFNSATSQYLLMELWPGELMGRVKEVIVHRDMWARMYRQANQVNNGGIQDYWLVKDMKSRTLYVHGVPCLSDDVADMESLKDDLPYTFQGLKYLSEEAIEADPEASPPVEAVPAVYRYRVIAVLAPLQFHGIFLPGTNWMRTRGEEPSDEFPRGKPPGLIMDSNFVMLSYLSAPFEDDADRVGMAVLDCADKVGDE